MKHLDTPWRRAEIERRLSISTICFKHRAEGDGLYLDEHQIARLREAGISRVEICGLMSRAHYDVYDPAQIECIRRACEDHEVEITSVHGPTACGVTSEYLEIRKASLQLVADALRVAEDLGAALLVQHFGAGEAAERAILELMEMIPESPVILTTENGLELGEFVQTAEKIDSPIFGLTVDIGHTRDTDGVNPFTKKDRARETLAQCGKHLRHLHLHDFIDRDHYAPFTGDIQWEEVFLALDDIDYSGDFLFEAAFPDEEEVISKTAEVPLRFPE